MTDTFCDTCRNVHDCIPVRPDILRSIADTLDARADAEQPMTPAEMRSLALALQDLAAGHVRFDATIPHRRAEATIVMLRPVWPASTKGD